MENLEIRQSFYKFKNEELIDMVWDMAQTLQATGNIKDGCLLEEVVDRLENQETEIENLKEEIEELNKPSEPEDYSYSGGYWN